MCQRARILSSKLINLKNAKNKPKFVNLLNPDLSEIEDPLPEINMTNKTVHVFGHFDQPLFLSLCKVKHPHVLKFNFKGENTENMP